MIFEKTAFEGLVLIKPHVFEDSRGAFFESYNQRLFSENGINDVFVQDNQSFSTKNVLRGIHFQIPPFAQSKLVRVNTGAVIDVALDLRKESKTFGKHFKIKLTEQNKFMLYIPKGFGHAFLSLSDNTVFNYKCDALYNKECERSIFWNDATLNIDWGIQNPLLSDKDKIAPLFNEFVSPF